MVHVTSGLQDGESEGLLQVSAQSYDTSILKKRNIPLAKRRSYHQQHPPHRRLLRPPRHCGGLAGTKSSSEHNMINAMMCVDERM